MGCRTVIYALMLLATFSCSFAGQPAAPSAGNMYASLFELLPDAAVSISPFTGDRDTLYIDAPMDNIVCMSSSHVAFLSEAGAVKSVSAVSGVRFLSDRTLAENPALVEVGDEAAFDYEAVMKLKPDVVLAYTVSSVEPQYIARLRSLGVRVFIIYDHLEHHPLARAEYIRLAGALTGRRAQADSVFNAVCEKYVSLAAAVSPRAVDAGMEVASGREHSGRRVKVLMNLPFSDMWYVPGEDNYMSYLIRDAGGEVLGARKGRSSSSVISVEEAYRLSREADFWLHPGSCTTRDRITEIHPLFSRFGPMKRPRSIFNNVAQSNASGGNAFWESGAVHPELILSDLIAIFNGDASGCSRLHYYIEVE